MTVLAFPPGFINQNPDDEGVGAVLRLVVGMDQIPEQHQVAPWERPYIYRARADGPRQLYSSGPGRISVSWLIR